MSLIDALYCRNTRRPPIWLMRQAGRYLPEYRALKKGRSLLEMFHNVETIVEVTTLPLPLIQPDAAILFSDILTVLDGLGLRYDFREGSGPVVFDPAEAIERRAPEEAYAHVIEAIKILKKSLKVPLLGFAGAPFTIASYILEQGSSRDLKKTKKRMYADPLFFQGLIDTITAETISYLQCQQAAGAQAVQLFDSWAGSLDPEAFTRFSLEPMQKIIEALEIPVLIFCRGSCTYAEKLATIKPRAISLDWCGSLPALRPKIPASIALQGNLDPMVLYAPQEVIREKASALLEAMRGQKGFIFNLGHGLLPDTPVENVRFLVDYVRHFS